MKQHPYRKLIITAALGISAITATAVAAPKPPKIKIPKHESEFAKADADKSGSLNIFEFAKTQGPGTPLVEVRKRFLPIDVSGAFEVVIDPVTNLPAVDPVTGEPVVGASIPDGFVTLSELNAYRALKTKMTSKLSKFELADFNGDGLLDPIEFGYLVSPRVKIDNVLRNFDKRDTDGNDFLSEEEFDSDLTTQA